MRWLALVALASCKPSQPACTGKHEAKVEVKRVDDDSEFMKRLFAHVNPDRSGESQEPAALAAHIRADIDSWRVDQMVGNLPAGELPRHTDYYLFGDRVTVDRYIKDQGPVPDDRQIVFERVDPTHSRSYYVDVRSLIDDTMFASARSYQHPQLDRPGLEITLTAAGKDAWAKATHDNVGRKLAFLVDGEVASAPIINAPIENGHLTIMTPSADALVSRLGCTR